MSEAQDIIATLQKDMREAEARPDTSAGAYLHIDGSRKPRKPRYWCELRLMKSGIVTDNWQVWDQRRPYFRDIGKALRALHRIWPTVTVTTDDRALKRNQPNKSKSL